MKRLKTLLLMSVNLKTVILLGLIQVIILTLIGLWFLRLT